ncbi:MAG: hypothetical protein ACI80K_004381, partial [Paracoccaceae bacterium]
APLFGQTLEVNLPPGGLITVILDGAGSGVLSLPVSPALAGSTFFAQGLTVDAVTGAITMTNTVTLRFDPF